MPINTNSTPNPIKKGGTMTTWELVKDFFNSLLDLRTGMDREGTLENIQNNKRMKGSNAWLLMCSIMVASLGLDLNSPAVIIGAMLISPLMSPILGIGLGIGINDRSTLVISMQHFAIAIAIALITSFVYFKLTPFGSITDEILGRTEPTLLDGLVAIFGGLAGVISITRKDKSNAVPGVAIATALMPPLCVAGYGLANGEWDFFINAFYLFFLNSSFIAITTYIIIRVLRFPYKKYMNQKERRKNNMYIFIFSTIILIPALTILYDTVQRTREKQNIEVYLKANIQDDDTIISDWTVVGEKEQEDSDTTQLILKIIGEPLSQEHLMKCDSDLEALTGKHIKLITYQSEEIPIEDMKKLEKELSGFQGEFAKRIQALEQLQANKNAEIVALTSQMDSLNAGNMLDVYQEIKTLFPLVEEVAIAKDVMKTDFVNNSTIPIAMVKWNKKKSTTGKKRDESKLTNFIKIRIKQDTIQLIQY